MRKIRVQRCCFSEPHARTLSFFSLVFSKTPRKTSKIPRISLTVLTLKNSVKQAENTGKHQGNSHEEKHQGNRNTKEKKDKGSSEFHFARLTLSCPSNTSVSLLCPLKTLHSPILARPRPFLALSSPGPLFKQSNFYTSKRAPKGLRRTKNTKR